MDGSYSYSSIDLRPLDEESSEPLDEEEEGGWFAAGRLFPPRFASSLREPSCYFCDCDLLLGSYLLLGASLCFD